MTKPPDAAGLAAGLDAAGEALAAFAGGPARDAAEAVGDAFEAAGRRIAGELSKAARTGELSVKAMAAAVLSDLARIAIHEAVAAPLAAALGKAVGGMAFFGARAAGGPVTPGGAYLVGERGPEVFRPGVAGSVAPAAGPGVVVHVHVAPGGGMEEARRSAGQVAAALARAVQRGTRGL